MSKTIDGFTGEELPPAHRVMVELPGVEYEALIRFNEDDEEFVRAWLKFLRRRIEAEVREGLGIPAEARSFKGPIEPGLCSYCLQHSEHLQRDHIVPVKAGGTDDPSNIVAACPSCNRSKRDKSLLQFVAKTGLAS